MCRWRNDFNTAVGSGLGYLILIVSGWLLPAAPAVAEEVDLWLEKRGFTRLLVEHLESKLPSMDADDRGPVMVRLAQLYAELLSETEDRAIRISLEERARRLLEEVRGADAQSMAATFPSRHRSHRSPRDRSGFGDSWSSPTLARSSLGTDAGGNGASTTRSRSRSDVAFLHLAVGQGGCSSPSGRSAS